MIASMLAGMLLWAVSVQESNLVPNPQTPHALRDGSQSADKPGEAAASEKIAVPVKAVNLATQFGHHNYPASAFIERRQGRVEVIAKIGTDGKAISCVVTSTSGHPDLDLATCEGVYRATFVPAADQSGKAVQGAFTTAVTWNMLP